MNHCSSAPDVLAATAHRHGPHRETQAQIVRGHALARRASTRFTPGERIDFRLLRGPVPRVVETFTLTSTEHGSRLEYHGELGTDFAALGAWWGRIVAHQWQATVDATMRAVKAEAERKATRNH